ncbi:hypothetical protein ACHAPT_012751 [Fusarium lateritium]
MALRLDPEFAVAMEPFLSAPLPVYTDAISLREGNNAAAEATFQQIPYPDGIEENEYNITSVDGTNLTVRLFVPESTKESTERQRAVIYAFGGGYVSGSVSQFRSVIARAAIASITPYFGVEYRVAPEHPYPAAVEDIYSTITWLQEHASDFNVDPARIVLHGQSAGAGVVAGTAIMARDKKLSPPLAAQVLKYPMLDDRTTLAENSSLSDFLLWSLASNDIGWEAYLGKSKAERVEADISPYAAPARVKEVAGLPRTLIEVGNLDLFRDEATKYASRLAAADIDTEFHLYAGLAHGYDGIAPNIKKAKAAEDAIARFVSTV